eukprot:12746405-Alexandrium_andersonii.AAC.1
MAPPARHQRGMPRKRAPQQCGFVLQALRFLTSACSLDGSRRFYLIVSTRLVGSVTPQLRASRGEPLSLSIAGLCCDRHLQTLDP